MNKLERDSIDAALHLLDRQVIAADGMLLCKIDDLEITDVDGKLTVTGILTGGAALFPRLSKHLGGWLATTWYRLGAEKADRNVPRYLPLGYIAELGSAVTLRVDGEGLLDRQPAPGPGATHRRISQLLGLPVVDDESGTPLGRVLDVRLDPRGEAYPLHQLVVGRGRPGSLLGYDRGEVGGPALVAWVVRRLHRRSGEVPLSRVRAVEWREGRVIVRGGLDRLSKS